MEYVRNVGKYRQHITTLYYLLTSYHTVNKVCTLSQFLYLQ